MDKVCFVISPMGDIGSPTRIRADYVLETYIKPACEETGYEAVRADHQDTLNMVQGITTGAPKCANDSRIHGQPALRR